MKESDLKPYIEQLDEKITLLSKERDLVIEQIRELTAKRTEIQSLLKIVEMPPSKLRAQVIKAAGIESAEAVMSGE